MSELPKLEDSLETYVKLDDDRRMIVKYSEAGECYSCLLLNSNLGVEKKFSVSPSEDVLKATISALGRIGNEGDVEVFAFKEDMTPMTGSMRFFVDDEIIDSLRKVSEETLEKLVDDSSLDKNLRIAMEIALAERKGSDIYDR